MKEGDCTSTIQFFFFKQNNLQLLSSTFFVVFSLFFYFFHLNSANLHYRVFYPSFFLMLLLLLFPIRNDSCTLPLLRKCAHEVYSNAARGAIRRCLPTFHTAWSPALLFLHPRYPCDVVGRTTPACSRDPRTLHHAARASRSAPSS